METSRADQGARGFAEETRSFSLRRRERRRVRREQAPESEEEPAWCRSVRKDVSRRASCGLGREWDILQAKRDRETSARRSRTPSNRDPGYLLVANVSGHREVPRIGLASHTLSTGDIRYRRVRGTSLRERCPGCPRFLGDSEGDGKKERKGPALLLLRFLLAGEFRYFSPPAPLSCSGSLCSSLWYGTASYINFCTEH